MSKYTEWVSSYLFSIHQNTLNNKQQHWKIFQCPFQYITKTGICVAHCMEASNVLCVADGHRAVIIYGKLVCGLLTWPSNVCWCWVYSSVLCWCRARNIVDCSVWRWATKKIAEFFRLWWHEYWKKDLYGHLTFFVENLIKNITMPWQEKKYHITYEKKKSSLIFLKQSRLFLWYLNIGIL